MMFLLQRILNLIIVLYCVLNVNCLIIRYDQNTFQEKTVPSRYNKWLEPVEPINVEVGLRLLNFGPMDEKKSQFTVLIHIFVSWNDERLKLDNNNNQHVNRSYLEMNSWHLDRIWMPSLHFSNAKPFAADILKMPGQIYGTLDDNGKVFLIKKTKLDAGCRMNIKFYPMDTQHCSIEIESSSLSTRNMNLSWTNDAIQIPSNFLWSDFSMEKISTTKGRIHYKKAGPYHRLKATFKLRRHVYNYLFNVYFPSTLFVMSSWSSFWIDIPAAPARVALVLTTMLTHVTSTKSVHEQLPKSLFISSLDIWVIMCTMFIFAAIMEYSTANYYYHKVSRIRDKKPAEQPSSRNDAEGTRTRRTPTPVIEAKKDNIWHQAWIWIFPQFDEEHFSARRTALLIDYRSRFLFPITFILFNIIYWTILAIYSDDQE